MSSRVVALALVIVVATSAQAAERRGATSGKATRGTAAQSGGAATGRLLGAVWDAAGAAGGAIVVSATGPAGTVATRCRQPCRFAFQDLPPGVYVLRAHVPGSFLSSRSVVELKPGVATFHAMRLEQPSAAAPAVSPLLAAGVATGRQDDFALDFDDPARDPEPAQRPAAAEAADGVPSHDHAEKLWRLRRARRSVLKDQASLLPAVAAAAGGEEGFEAARGADLASPVGVATPDIADRFLFSGQVQLLTRMHVDAAGAPGVLERLPGQVTYLDIGPSGAEGEAGWGVQGAVTAGASGSWVLAGTYAPSTSPAHDLAIEAAYSRQRGPGAAGPLEISDPAAADLLHYNREAGSVAAGGEWVVSPHVALAYGATVAHYGYLDDGQLFSPRLALTVEPAAGTRVRAAVVRNMTAPGGEEFLRPVSGAWLPPERTFESLSASELLDPQRTRHLEVELERDLGAASVISLRRYSQDIGGQMVTLFGLVPGVSAADHYFLANAGDASADGWGVRFRHEVAGRIQGSVDYSMTRAHWTPWDTARWGSAAPGVDWSPPERMHDLTTSVETDIPETATRVVLLARVNSSYAGAAAGAFDSGLNARFAVRLQQALPFAPIDGSDWELLVDVRNLFYEQAAGASIYDELFVLNPPKQVVGGLVVHF